SLRMMISIRYPASESNLQVRSRKHMESQDEKPKSKYGTGVRAWSELRRKLCKYFCIPSNEAVRTQKANGLDVEITDLTAVQTLSVPCPTCAAAPREPVLRECSPVCCLPQDKELHHVSTSPLPMCFPMSISGRLWRTRRNTDAEPSDC